MFNFIQRHKGVAYDNHKWKKLNGGATGGAETTLNILENIKKQFIIKQECVDYNSITPNTINNCK